MGFKIPSGQQDGLQETHEINVTPFIDVMLVLLIIFMVAAPIATVSVPVDLPPSAVRPQPVDQEPLYLTLNVDKTLVLGEEQAVVMDELAEALAEHLGEDHEARIYVRADRLVEYGDIMDVMGRISQAGYNKVALVALEAP